MMKNKSTIAKLLANEDIHVVSKSMQTAYFNIKTRELGLPIWKDDITKDEEELMVCHEIGHALWTPMKLLTKSAELNIRKDFINVLEDARIEKFVKSKYPGSVNLFNKGYAALASRDFFGIGDTDPQEQNLIDRINLYFKGIPNIKFTDAESVFVNRTSALQTEEQVISLAADLQQYMQDNPEQSDSPDNDDSDDDSDDDNNDSGNSSESGEQSSNNENTSESDESDDDDNDDDNDDSNNSNKPYTPESKTDKAANESVKDLSDMNAKEKVYANIPKIKSENMIVDYKKVIEDLTGHYNKISTLPDNLWIENSAKEIKSYKNDSKKSVSYMVKEFEMKKSADQYARAATAKTGTLNMSKLHTYKYNDDLFKKVTTLPGATSHGMIIIVDWSGSMQNQLLGVFHQLLQLVWFCRRTQIPFEVLAFTQAYNRRVDDESRLKYVEPKYGDVAISESTSLLNFFSSRMSSSEEESMTHYLWMIVKRLSNYYENYNYTGFPTEFPMQYNLSNTPLNESIIALMDYAPKFKKQTGVQKLNTIFLTDGEANNLEGVHDYWRHTEPKYDDDGQDYVRSFSKDNLIVDPINNKQYEVNAIYGTWSELSRNLTETLLKAFKNRVPDMNVIGFFIAGTGRRGNIGHSEWYRILGLESTVDTINKARNAIKKDKVLVIKKSHGYDGYYIMPGGEQLEINTDLGLDDTLIGASKSKLKNAFAKSAKNRIQSRVMLNKFVEMVS